MKKSLKLLLLLCLMVVSTNCFSHESSVTTGVDRVVIDENTNVAFLINWQAVAASSCVTDDPNNNKKKRPRWYLDSVASDQFLSIALTAKTTGKQVMVHTTGCIGDYPRLTRIELL